MSDGHITVTLTDDELRVLRLGLVALSDPGRATEQVRRMALRCGLDAIQALDAKLYGADPRRWE